MTSKQSKGVYYGYPRCCIQSFHRMLKEGLVFQEISEVRRNATKNGFVPCLACAEKIVAGKIKIEDLISKNRQCPKPFSEIV